MIKGYFGVFSADRKRDEYRPIVRDLHAVYFEVANLLLEQMVKKALE